MAEFGDNGPGAGLFDFFSKAVDAGTNITGQFLQTEAATARSQAQAIQPFYGPTMPSQARSASMLPTGGNGLLLYGGIGLAALVVLILLVKK